MFTLKTNYFISVVVIATIFLFSCASTTEPITGVTTEKSAPPWIIDVTETFPEDEYLAAVGYATNRASSESMAISNLTKILKQRVESETEVNQTFTNNLVDQDRTIDASVRTTSLIDEIMGLKIQENWVAKDNTMYSIAVLNKNETSNYYKQLVYQNEETINDYLSIVVDNPATFTGIDACSQALELAYENDSYLELILVLDYTAYKSINLDYKSSSDIKVLMEMQNNLISIGIFVEGDVGDRISSAFSTTLNEAGFTTSKLSNNTDLDDIPYVVDGKLIFEVAKQSEQTNNIVVFFTLDANMKDETGKIMLPWSYIGKEVQTTESRAKQRALYTIEQYIKKEYLKALQNLSEN